MEYVVVAIDIAETRLIIAVIYRSPSSSMQTFIKEMEEFLLFLPQNIPTVITGDFNVNLANNSESLLTTLMNGYGFQQKIKEPTTDSGSLLDHIYFNRNENDTYTCVHLAI